MSFTTNRLSLRRRVLFGTTLLALGGFLATGVASCVTLPDIDPSKCGNSVLEPENGEACDVDSALCGSPSSIGACRFLCDYQDDAGIQCPTGFGCGLDGICRKSNGLTDSPISIGGGGIQKLMSGDFDGDGRLDVVAVGFSTADVHFLTTEGNIERTVTLPNDMGLPGVGDVNGDLLSDIVLSFDRSVGVLLGQEDRSFAPQSYTAMFVAPKTKKLVPLGAYSTDAVILAFGDVGGDTSVEFIKLNAEGGHERKPATMMPVSGTLVGEVATKGATISNIACGITAFEVGSKGVFPARLVVGSRCGTDDVVPNVTPLPGVEPWGGAYFAKKDNDNVAYLFFGVTNGNPSLKVIKTDMAGVAGAPENFLDYEAGNCIESIPSLASEPLAVGDLNGDSYPDFVDSRGILLYNPNKAKQFTRICHSYSFTDPMDLEKTSVSWTHAVIGDFNGDGLDDVLGSRVGEGVLDLWTWQSGGFNTIPISVGDRVDELVTGDFDGDTIADAAFRFAAPPDMGMGMGGKTPPTPLFAMFGNPLSLPSPPQSLGFLDGMKHIAAGRIKGISSAGQPDILSDLVVLSEGNETNQTMPLTLFQGNITRNLAAPLSLQRDSTTLEVKSTDTVFGVFISKFGVPACDRFNSSAMMTMTDTPPEPSSIVALGSSGSIWLAGCKADGSSLPAQEKLKLGNGSFLFAPVDRALNNDALAVFMSNPPFDDGMGMGMDRLLGLGTIEYQGGTEFSDLPKQLSGISSDIRLPKAEILKAETLLNVPFAFADLDNNGLRDVILTGKTGTQRKIFIFWNGDANDLSGNITANSTTMTEYKFNPNVQPSRSDSKSRADESDIMDVVGINFDDDQLGELAILTQEHVYIAKPSRVELTEVQTEGSAPLTLPLLFGNQAFADIRGGKALLSIDANSDGIDDLIVADSGKLLLYIGTERLK
jgi:hypothetical protein